MNFQIRAISDPAKLREERLRRSARGQVDAMNFRTEEQAERDCSAGAFVHYREIGNHCRERLTVPFLRGCFFTTLLADAALASWSFFHFGTHGAKIVGGGDYREKNDEDASQSQQNLDGSEAAAVMSRSGVAPQPISR